MSFQGAKLTFQCGARSANSLPFTRPPSRRRVTRRNLPLPQGHQVASFVWIAPHPRATCSPCTAQADGSGSVNRGLHARHWPFSRRPVTLRVPPGPRPHGKPLQCLWMTLASLLGAVWVGRYPGSRSAANEFLSHRSGSQGLSRTYVLRQHMPETLCDSFATQRTPGSIPWPAKHSFHVMDWSCAGEITTTSHLNLYLMLP